MSSRPEDIQAIAAQMSDDLSDNDGLAEGLSVAIPEMRCRRSSSYYNDEGDLPSSILATPYSIPKKVMIEQKSAPVPPSKPTVQPVKSIPQSTTFGMTTERRLDL